MSEIGLIPTYEGVKRYALQGIGSLRVEGDWDGATARAGGESWRFVSSGNTTAVDAAGRVIGDYRGRERALRWGGRQLQLRPVRRWWSLVVSSSRAGVGHVLADGERILAVLDGNMGRPHRPVNVKVDDAAGLEPGLLLFVVFVVGRRAYEDWKWDGT